MCKNEIPLIFGRRMALYISKLKSCSLEPVFTPLRSSPTPWVLGKQTRYDAQACLTQYWLDVSVSVALLRCSGSPGGFDMDL